MNDRYEAETLCINQFVIDLTAYVDFTVNLIIFRLSDYIMYSTVRVCTYHDGLHSNVVVH